MALVLQFLATFLRGQMRSDIGRDRTNLLGGEGIEKWALLSAKNVSALDRRRQRRWTAAHEAQFPVPKRRLESEPYTHVPLYIPWHVQSPHRDEYFALAFG